LLLFFRFHPERTQAFGLFARVLRPFRQRNFQCLALAFFQTCLDLGEQTPDAPRIGAKIVLAIARRRTHIDARLSCLGGHPHCDIVGIAHEQRLRNGLDFAWRITFRLAFIDNLPIEPDHGFMCEFKGFLG